MSTIIDNAAYECLRGYAVFAGSGITFNASTGTTLNGGVYGSYPTNTVTGKVNSTFGGTPATVTQGNNLAGDQRARSELEALYLYLAGNTAGFQTYGALTGPTLPNGNGGQDYVFLPGFYDITGGIAIGTNDTISFSNPSNLATPQWVIYSNTTITFTGVDSIDYTDTTPQSIYWVADSIEVDATTTATLNGIFIAAGSITFEGARNPDAGAAYADANGGGLGEVIFLQPATMTGLGYAAICFLEDTPINTDQGILRIDKIVAGVNTINNKRIVAVTKTIDGNTFLVCFKKDSLGENIPSQDTITSRHHAVEYNGEMLEARHFLDKFDNVVKVEYNGETLYNILMDEHAKITVNNLVCETLNPDHPYSQKYKKPVVNM